MSSASPSFEKTLLDALAQASPEEALTLLQQAAQDHPTSPWPPFLLGAELAEERRYQEAETAYATAVTLDPQFAIARFELGVLQLTSGRPAVALVTWQALLALPEDDPLHLFVRGYAALVRDAFGEALHYFHAGMAANTANPPLNTNINLLVQKIEALQQAQAEPEQQESDDILHFLLNTYGNNSIH